MKRPALTAVLSALLLTLPGGPALAQWNPEPGDLLWSQEIGGQLWAPLMHHEGTLYFGSDDSTFYAFDIEAREVKWRFHTGGMIRSGAEVIGDNVVFASDDGFLYALALESGKESWRFDLGSAGIDRVLPAIDPPYSYDYRHSSPLNRGGVIYVGSADGVLYAIYEEIGLLRWRFEAGGPIRSTPVTDGRNVYFGSWDGHVDAIDAVEGEHPSSGLALELRLHRTGGCGELDGEGDAGSLDDDMLDEAEIDDALAKVGVHDRLQGFQDLCDGGLAHWDLPDGWGGWGHVSSHVPMAISARWRSRRVMRLRTLRTDSSTSCQMLRIEQSEPRTHSGCCPG